MTRAAVVLAACLAAGALAGCGADPVPASSGTTPTAAASSTTVPTPAPRRTTPATNAAEPPDTPEPQTAPPPRTAGPLTARNVPPPGELGGGWTTYDDPGGSEAGFIGNGSWTRRRDAHQAAFEALPLGCANVLPATPMPVPRNALQATYRNQHHAPAQVLVLRFATPAQASSYLSGYLARMSACGSGGNLSVLPMWRTTDAAASVRRYAGAETYAEVAVRRGATVGLLATSTTDPAAERAWTRTAAIRLAARVDR
jgi:hypothetical protein